MLLVTIVFSEKTLAQATRTWVSGVGDDVNPCSRTAPCKTFAGAISKTAVGGEINVLDPGGFGAVTITKSITIDGKGTMGHILSPLVNAINITTTPGITVTLRNLSINGAGTGTNGIRITVPSNVHIDNCTINGITSPSGANGNAILVDYTTAGSGILTVKNTTISGPADMNGISVKCSTAVATDKVIAFIDNVHMQDIGTAVISKTATEINVVNSYISNSIIAISPEAADSIIRLSNTSIMNNGTGIGTGSGKVISFGNNQIIANTTSAKPTVVSSTQ
ncbi:right-handed parallel beta-helix repeat-containing protein [Emticicia sp. C21]|nr:right-handed parallel beta-helix repeat-containing protein [Emticicia sp. C21]